MKINPVDEERRALQRIRFRCEGGIGGRAFSPLENIDGTNPIIDSIDALRASPLCWEDMPTMNDYWATKRALDSLQVLYERAMAPWDQFRTVQNPKRFMYVLGMGNPTDVDLRRPSYAFPIKIRQEAKTRYFELMTTSRFSVEDGPSKSGLEKVSPPGGPITFAHLAGLVSTVCVARAVGEFEETLKYWAEVCSIEPGQSFMWVACHDRDRVKGILTSLMNSPSGDQGHVDEMAHSVAVLIKSAEGWLALADAEGTKQQEIECTVKRVTAQAEVQTLDKVKAARKKQANEAAAAPRGRKKQANEAAAAPCDKWKELTPQWVADYFMSRTGEKRDALVHALVISHGVGERTVRRRIAAAKAAGLMS